MAERFKSTADRIVRLRRLLRPHGAAALLVNDPVNVGYLSGFTGDDSWLLAGPGKPWLITDFRYVEQAEIECPRIGRIMRKGTLVEALAKRVCQKRLTTLAYDPETVSVYLRSQLVKRLKGVRLIPVRGVVSGLRMRKDAGEIRAIEAALRVAEHAFHMFRRRVDLGMTEQRLAAELDHQMRLAGAEAVAFPTIIAIDASASMPHARPGNRRLKRGSILLVDFGAQVAGYVCDLTRVLIAGRIRPLVRSAYELVYKAQAAGIDKVGPGVPLTEVDAAARHIIQDEGLNDAFQHGLGHGFGRQVHEGPSIGPRGVKGNLDPGMVVTIEPGVYLKGRFGIRIEDDVLVTETGHRVLSHLEKDLEAMVL
jgi:Xaa-Pro aminopeptidase